MSHRPSHVSRRQMIAAQANAGAAGARHRDRLKRERDALADAITRAQEACDAIEAETNGHHDETTDALRATVTRIRAALEIPEPRP
ncbi:hypothetical protein [Streptomyces sp. x-80]|uniref:hypothetical protein n=1 Tax=Streptomyces sp. x-80 TaxID=2789282 RepID=UPI0039819398